MGGADHPQHRTKVGCEHRQHLDADSAGTELGEPALPKVLSLLYRRSAIDQQEQIVVRIDDDLAVRTHYEELAACVSGLLSSSGRDTFGQCPLSIMIGSTPRRSRAIVCCPRREDRSVVGCPDAAWGEVVVAHPSQIHPVSDKLSDEAAVLIEPLACCIHAALRGGATKDDIVVVSGSGTIGLLTIAAVKTFTPPKRLIAIAKHPTQRDLALKLGADQVVAPADVFQRVRFATGSRRLESMNRSLLLGGADITFECVGRADSLNDVVRFTREGGTVVAVGMPGEEKVDWAPIWQRELTVMGAYAYGTEPKRKARKTFDLALEASPSLNLEQLTGPLFGLGEYRDAIEYAMSAGRLGAVKVAFDLRRLRI